MNVPSNAASWWSMLRGCVLRPLALLALVSTCGVAAAQGYPNRPIKFIVPFPAGGDLEPVARGLAEHFQKIWGQPGIVDFKAGAQAMIGTEFVARSAPDGYTLLVCSVGAMTINPSLYEKVPYTVGTSGAVGERCAVLTASTFTRPAFTCAAMEGIAEYAMVTSPLTSAGIDWPVPLYGM
jgi:hypothetical protein